jgi:D,D-heptose 1,7-bisphosphate phosphatase
MNKAIFLDRDGTITPAGDHPCKIKDMEFIDSAMEGLRRMQKFGYPLIIVTNQAGIAKGFFKEEDYFSFRNEMHKQLQENGIIINAEYFCPHHTEGIVLRYRIDCNCRKPKTGMLEQAAKDFNLDLKKCWMIGDSISDIKAGKNAGCKTIQVLSGEEKKELDEADFIAYELVHASYFIS